MMAGVKSWLMAVISVSVLITAADSLMPAGGVKKVGRLACGLVLLCVLSRPLAALRGVELAGYLAEYGQTLRQEEAELERQGNEMRKTVIEDYCAAYILDKAEELGISCRAEVECGRNGEGLYLPKRARLWGKFEPAVQSRLTELLERELGIPASEQTYYLT